MYQTHEQLLTYVQSIDNIKYHPQSQFDYNIMVAINSCETLNSTAILKYQNAGSFALQAQFIE